MARNNDSTVALPTSKNLTFRQDKRRWVKWIKEFKATRYFGRSHSLEEAEAHYDHYVDTGEYLPPQKFAELNGLIEAQSLVAAPANVDSNGFSTIRLAERWRHMTEVERDRALPGPLKGLPLQPRSDAEGWYWYWLPPSGGRKMLKKFPANPHLARLEYLDLLSRGKSIRRGDAIAIKEYCQRVMDALQDRVIEDGNSQERLNQYIDRCHDLRDHFGDDQIVDDISPTQWTEFKKAKLMYRKKQPTVRLAKRTTNDRIADVRFLLDWGVEEKLIHEPCFNKKDFRAYSKTEVENEQEERDRAWEPQEILAFLKHERERPIRRAMILLAINCGLGNKDLAILTTTDKDFDGYHNKIDLENGWLESTRPKTRKRRKMKLWPETIAALREIMQTPETMMAKHGWSADEDVRLKVVADLMYCSPTNLRKRAQRLGMKVTWGKISGYNAGRLMLYYLRPEATDPQFSDLLFRTKSGRMFVYTSDKKNKKGQHARVDNVKNFTDDAIKAIGLNRELSFYGIRHSFNTRGRQAGDDPIVFKHIMGWRLQPVEQAYIESKLIDEHVYERIAHGIREWLFASEWEKAEILPGHWHDNNSEQPAIAV
jgi:integrase